MSKFKFRLATFLRLREAFRDDRRAELAEAYRADDLVAGRQTEVARELLSLEDECRRAAGPGPVQVDLLLEAQRYEILLKAHAQQLGRQRDLLAAEIERRRQALVHANRDVRVLEKLREHQAAGHRQEEHRREIKQIDEVAQQRALGSGPS